VDRFRFMEENERVIAAGGRPATRRGFQETTRVRSTSIRVRQLEE